MPDTVTPVSYYMGTIPHKVGEGAKVLGAFKNAGVSLTGWLGYPKNKRNAEIVVVVDEQAPNLAPIAKKAGFELGKKQKGFLVTGEDRLGVAEELMSKLAAAGVNVVSAHAICGGAGRYGALIVVDSTDNRKAAKALGI